MIKLCADAKFKVSAPLFTLDTENLFSEEGPSPDATCIRTGAVCIDSTPPTFTFKYNFSFFLAPTL